MYSKLVDTAINIVVKQTILPFAPEFCLSESTFIQNTAFDFTIVALKHNTIYKLEYEFNFLVSLCKMATRRKFYTFDNPRPLTSPRRNPHAAAWKSTYILTNYFSLNRNCIYTYRKTKSSFASLTGIE